MLALEALLVTLTLLGSAALCIHVFNHSHARSFSHGMDKTINLAIQAWFLAGPVVLAVAYWRSDRRLIDMLADFQPVLPMVGVVVFLLAFLRMFLNVLGRPRSDRPATLISNHTARLNLLRQLGPESVPDATVRRLAALPGNQLVELSVHEKKLRIARLPAALEGFSVAHLTDLHFTGRVGKSYFEEVVRRTNDLEADMIAVTGDLVDKTPCLDWIPDTFGRLTARLGVYYVLGNHDLRVDSAEVHRRLQSAGLVRLGGRWQSFTINGATVVLAGNELPWFPPAADLSDCPSRDQQQQLRILLSHSPDQIQWATHWDADLMLAGHTHGGQIRLPLIGPLASSSRMGTRYVAGTYQVPPSVLHVSRGISSTFPIRFNCLPELSRLELHA